MKKKIWLLFTLTFPALLYVILNTWCDERVTVTDFCLQAPVGFLHDHINIVHLPVTCPHFHCLPAICVFACVSGFGKHFTIWLHSPAAGPVLNSGFKTFLATMFVRKRMCLEAGEKCFSFVLPCRFTAGQKQKLPCDWAVNTGSFYKWQPNPCYKQ